MTTKISDEAVEAVARVWMDFDTLDGHDKLRDESPDWYAKSWPAYKGDAELLVTAAFAHFAAHPEQLPEGFWYAPVEGPKPDDCPACFGSGKTVRPQIPQTCGECGGSGKV